MTTAQLPAQSSTPPASTLPLQQVARIQKAAQDFEAMALGQMLAPMFETVDTSKGAFGGGSGEEAWKPMMVTELGKQMAKSGGVGLARPVMEQMIRMQEAHNDGAAGAVAPQGVQKAPTGQAPREHRPTQHAPLHQSSLRPGA